MTIEDIKYFNTIEGKELLQKYRHLSDDDLEMLAFSLVKKKVPHYPYLITLLKLRKKAREKFSRADEMFFDSLSLEMATSEKIAKHIALRFKKYKKIVDLTCGIGGNSIFLAKHSKIVAIDLEKTSIEMAKLNAKAYGVEKNIEFRVGNAFFHLDSDADAFFIDPMRSREGKSKTRSFLNGQPRLDELLPRMMEITSNICVKISPAFDYKEVQNLSEAPEIELISENNENKVALLWFGDFKKSKSRATMFFGDKKTELVYEDNILEVPIIEKPQKYVYEPNKAIIKAHLIDEVALKNDLAKINKNIAFLTSDSEIIENREKFRIFEVLKYSSFSLKNLKKDLKRMKLDNISVINRGTPILPEKLIKDLKTKEGSDAFILITKLKDEKNYYLIAKRINS